MLKRRFLQLLDDAPIVLPALLFFSLLAAGPARFITS
jgi:hypothetical protein